MARYLKEYNVYEKLRIEFHLMPKDVEEFLAGIPKEDVVPRSEYEKYRQELGEVRFALAEAKNEVEKADKEIERLIKILENYALQYGTVTDKQKVIDQAKQKVAREIFEEFDNLIVTLEIGDNEKASVLDYNKYTELKKKRIGE